MMWKKILLLPLIGSVDSKRSQIIMDKLLKMIAETEAKFVILEILCVPAVDTLVANHIIKLTKATKLLGCTCVVTGVAPQISQTLVQLGIDLKDKTTKSSLKEGLQFAIEKKSHEEAEQENTSEKK